MYENAIKKSIQNFYINSRSKLKNTILIKTVKTNNIEYNSCYSKVALPMLKTEVVIWTKDNIIELNEICITININFVSVKLVDFITTIIECKDKYKYKQTLSNNNFSKSILLKMI